MATMDGHAWVLPDVGWCHITGNSRQIHQRQHFYVPPFNHSVVRWICHRYLQTLTAPPITRQQTRSAGVTGRLGRLGPPHQTYRCLSFTLLGSSGRHHTDSLSLHFTTFRQSQDRRLNEYRYTPGMAWSCRHESCRRAPIGRVKSERKMLH